MEIINNRYRLKELVNQEMHVTTYTAYDMRDDNKVILLNILNSEYLPESLIDFFINRFLDIKDLASKSIIRNYSFNAVSYIDNKIQQAERQYFYTTEYITGTEDLFQYTQNKSFREIMDCFIDLSTAVHYLHLKGFIYGALNRETIRVSTLDSDVQILLKDVATVKMERMNHSERLEDSVFRSPKVLAGMPDNEESDIYSLGVILVAMLSGNSALRNPRAEIAVLAEKHPEAKPLIPILERILETENTTGYENLYELIVDLNVALNTEYSIVKMDEFPGLNLNTKLVGRDNKVKEIFKAYEKMVSYQPGKRIFFVQGPNGIGKTRFLQEVNFLFELSQASVYSSYSLSNLTDGSKDMWIDILRRLIMETDTSTVEKYNKELVKYFPELADKSFASSANYMSETNTKYRLLNRIAGFISESIQDRPAVIIVDNIHLADDFTIDTFHYLCTEVLENTNLSIIFSCDDSEITSNSVSSDFIVNMKRRADSETIRLEPLDEKQTGEMIQSILSISFTPRNISRRIYRQSYGNPLFITEIMKDLYSRHIIFVGEETGKWQIDLPEDDKNYNLLELPNSVEHALVNQLKDLEPTSIEILMSISLFSKPVSTEMIESLVRANENLEDNLGELVSKGVLQRLIDDSSYLYDFRSRVLKNIVYDRIEDSEKAKKHKKAAELLEEKIDIEYAPNLDELILHYVKANDREKARSYYLLNAEKLKAARNTKAQIENLRSALDFTPEIESTKLLIEIGILLSDIGDVQLATEHLEKAERLAIEKDEHEHIIKAYLNLANVKISSYENDKAEVYIAKLEKELEIHDNEEARLELKRMKALILLDTNHISEAREAFEEVIEECGDRYPKVKGNAYRTLGFIYMYLGRAEQALEVYHKSIEVLEQINNTRGVLLGLNNIGAVYADVYEDFDKAMEYHLQVKNLSEEYGIYTSEVFGLINIAESYLNKYDFDTAFEHFHHAYTKAERYHMASETFMINNFLTQVSLERDHYTDAILYYDKLRMEFEENPIKGFDVGEYYTSCAKLYYKLGNYEKADYFYKKVIEFHSEHENLLKYIATVKVLINELRQPNRDMTSMLTEQILTVTEKITNKSANIENLCEAIIILSYKREYEDATTLLRKVEEYIHDEAPHRLKAIYMHAKGAVEFGVNRDNAICYLEESLELAKRSTSKELTSRISADLGDCYFIFEKYYEAANYYLESCEGIKNLIRQLPDEYKLNFINGRDFSKGFYRLGEIWKWMVTNGDVTIDQEVSTSKVQTLDELEKIMHTDQVSAFIGHQAFMDYISNQYMDKLSNNILHRGDIIRNLESDVLKNLDMLGKFLAGRLLATKGYIIAEKRGQELVLLSSTDGSKKLPDNLPIINRVRATLKPALITANMVDDKVDFHLLANDQKAIMCIPIVKKLDSEDNVINFGYIYLETDRIVNNFSEVGLEISQELINLLVLLLEKRQLKISASIDKLTGALTRKYLEDALQNTLDVSRRNRKDFSVIMFDLDKFKGVNDRYGHQIGDQILRDVSTVILNNIDGIGTLGRYGGEEFIIILPSVEMDEAHVIAEKLRTTVQEQKLLGDKQEVTLSMGIASYPEHGQTVREIILKADQALYIAKEKGRNNSQIWQKDFENKVKPANRLTGIVSGDEIRDSRNVLALVELIQLTNKNLPLEDKFYQFIGRIIEIIEAQYGYILLTDGITVVDAFGRKSQEEDWIHEANYNKELVESVISDGQGVYTIDWDQTDKINMVNGLPDWDSVIAAPVTTNGRVKGVMYLSVPARVKEFGADELNVLNIYSELMASII
ncbi:diguanylate cyclase [Ornithinibacillus scapharcae]|uniref:diguanylate cyclase n=1 Tax=Ornithinibacillus scapharcae TaxID=1147159 RepID=UPI000225BC92|nr:diguanylate cyclase [Ornithinibacillus scapharcae]